MQPVFVKTARQYRLELRVEACAAGAKEIRRDRPVGGANRNFHRRAPVDSETRRIGRDEIQHLVAELADVTFRSGEARRPAARQNVSPRQLRQMLHPRQFPRHLDVHSGLVTVADIQIPGCTRTNDSRT